MRKLLVLAALGLTQISLAARAMELDELLARHLEARGGLENLRAIKSLRMTGKIALGPAGNVVGGWGELKIRGTPGSSRSELSLQGQSNIEAFDGRESWSINPFGGRREAERGSADEARLAAEEADLDGPLVDWQAKGHRVELLGTEDVDGSPAWKVRAELKGGDIFTVFIDPDSMLAVRETSQTFRRGVESINETDFGGYAQVAGVWMPLAIDSGEKGRPRTSRITLERVEVNVPLDAALFRFPPGGRASPAIAPGPDAKPIASVAPPKTSAGQPPAALDPGALSGLGIRNIGSATMSGRIAALAARNDGGKTLLLVGSASGGIWKSQDGGTTFKPVFDKQPVQSIGALALDPTNPRVVWAGTGEAWTRNSVSIGDGIYKSTDLGETWVNMGLPHSERIGRILVNPKDGNVVYACVAGKLWSDSDERGLYKTADGGRSWSLILKGGNPSTGCSGLSLDPKNPEIVFAGLWDFRRKGWTFRSGGDGETAPSGSAFFRSADGGQTWAELGDETAKGLPKKPWGRVEVQVAPSDARIVYALIESKDSALYRSSDGGQTWEARDKSQMMVWRPFYFGRLIIDPTNPDKVWKPDLNLIASEDGGRSFSPAGGSAHGDWHDVWIDPQNPKHVVGGDDGGLWTSFDGGSRWWKSNNLPVSQFYHVAVDDKDPYLVYGGLQDNSSWVGPSARDGGIKNADWTNLYGGDGFWVLPDPSNPDLVYAESQGGHIGLIDRAAGYARGIQPLAGFKEKLRFNWNAPIALSPTEKNTLYIGAQCLFRSKDRGDSWERISPDLSTNDPEKQKQEESGGVTIDNSSAEMHTTLYSISESPLDSSMIWVGTDDGNLQLTRDGGKSWKNLAGNLPGVPKASWVSWVEASRFEKGVAYAAIDRHTFGDLEPWVFRTADFGATWKRIAAPGQGVRGYAHVIKEDTEKASLLFLGTELGLWISLDAGAHWTEFKGNDFPSVAVRDLQVQKREGDLVLATHGRGIWIIDDLSPLRALSAETLARDAVFLPGRQTQERMGGPGGWIDGDAAFTGENPPRGAVVSYYQRARHLYGPIKLEVLDEQGKVVGTLPASRRRGLNRAVWSMQLPPPRTPRGVQNIGAGSSGPRVMPGNYTVRLTKGSEVTTGKLEIRLDRRAPFRLADRKEQFDALRAAGALFEQMTTLSERLEAARTAATARSAALPEGDALRGRLDALAGKLEVVRKKIVATKEGGAITGEERLREHLDELYSSLMRFEGRPGRYHLERLEALTREEAEVAAELKAIETGDIAPLNTELGGRKLELIPTHSAR